MGGARGDRVFFVVILPILPWQGSHLYEKVCIPGVQALFSECRSQVHKLMLEFWSACWTTFTSCELLDFVANWHIPLKYLKWAMILTCNMERLAVNSPHILLNTYAISITAHHRSLLKELITCPALAVSSEWRFRFYLSCLLQRIYADEVFADWSSSASAQISRRNF